MKAPLLGVVALLVAACATLERDERVAARHPNIVLVITDDQGLGDYGCMGNDVLDTPHLDRLAAESPSVERFYVNSVCSPTRASLMTGRYAYRTRVVDTWIGRSMMEPDEVTIAELLRDAGYRTGIFGKWHLGDCYPMRPIDQGFDTSLVHRGGGLAQPSEPPANELRYTDAILFRDGAAVQTAGYCTDVYFDAALAFIDESLADDRPFFAYVATNAPHGPFHDVPKGLHAKYAARDLSPVLSGDGENADQVARIFAMIENIDANVGELRAGLRERGVERDTLFVFLGDNGPIGGRYVAGLRGSKGGMHEGSLRSPLWMSWPGRIGPDAHVGEIAAHIDVLPTLLDAAGVRLPDGLELDGRSLMPLIDGSAKPWPQRQIVLQNHRGDVPHREHHFALIGERWKLVHATGFGRPAPPRDHPFELYDLTADPGEQNDQAASHLDVVARLRDDYRAWFDDVSTTHPDNFAPPRIVIGTDHETTTTLTRQDWREAQRGGWGTMGTWLLHARERAELDLWIRLTEARDIDAIELHLNDVVLPCEIQPSDGGLTLYLGRVVVPAGDVDLSIEMHADDDLFGPYQATLERP